MGPKLDKWTATATAALLVGALLACKKEEPPPPATTAAPAPEPPPEEPKKEEPKKKKDEVKRYPDKEIDESGTVRVIVNHLKVFPEADATVDHIATLSFGTLVNRKARMGDWMLIDYPSGVAELSPGWVLNRQIAKKIEKVKPEDVLKQDAGVVINKPDAAAAAPAAPDAAAAAPAKPDAAAAAEPAKPDAGRKPRLKLPNLAKPTQ